MSTPTPSPAPPAPRTPTAKPAPPATAPPSATSPAPPAAATKVRTPWVRGLVPYLLAAAGAWLAHLVGYYGLVGSPFGWIVIVTIAGVMLAIWAFWSKGWSKGWPIGAGSLAVLAIIWINRVGGFNVSVPEGSDPINWAIAIVVLMFGVVGVWAFARWVKKH